MIRKVAAVAAVLIGSLLVATPTMASQNGLTGGLTKDQQTFPTTGRTITASGSNIYV
jgi:hypothetical protein